jgi:NADPH-dependent ferric siderophore reductase
MPDIKRMLISVIGPRLLPVARIVGNEAVSPHFRCIELESESLSGSLWEAGSKVQINTGDWMMRTYTPLSIDPAKARMTILAFLPGHGPGSAWASSAKPGDTTQFVSPQSSIKVSKLEPPVVLFGDETAFGLALSLKTQLGTQGVLGLFLEVSSPQESQQVLSRFGIDDAVFYQKNEDLTIASQIVESLQKTSGGLKDCQIVLAGRAQSIQTIRAQLKSAQIPAARMTTKAYWSQGKAGLD